MTMPLTAKQQRDRYIQTKKCGNCGRKADVMRAWDGDMGLTEGWNGTKVPLCLLCKDALDTSPASPWDADPHEVFDAAKDHPESCQCPVCRLMDLVYGRFWDELALLPQHCQAEFAALLNRAGMYNTVEDRAMARGHANGWVWPDKETLFEALGMTPPYPDVPAKDARDHFGK